MLLLAFPRAQIGVPWCLLKIAAMRIRLPFLGATLAILLGGASARAQVLTSQYNNARTGANLKETILTPQNVNSKQFGKVFSFIVDGDTYAQPLYVPGVDIPGKGRHNLLFVATEHDSVYAFDADGTSTAPLWHVSFIDDSKSIRTLSSNDVHCPFIAPEIGISSTPVIDLPTGTLYVLSRTMEPQHDGHWHYEQKLHALAISTGAEKFGGPVKIRARIEGAPFLLFKSHVDFDTLKENQRAALLLVNGKVVITWASSCDVGPYYGWIIAYDAHTLAQAGVLNISPDAGESGIWQGDAGPAADAEGNIYLISGNGKFTAASGGHDYGDSVVKLAFTATGLAVRDYFTPSNQAHLNDTDGDFGSGAPILLPDQPGPHSHLLLAAGKAGLIYELDRDNLGKFHKGDDSHAVQVVAAGIDSFGAPAYWNGHVYYFLSGDYLRDYPLQNGRLPKEPAAKSTTQFTDPGATPAISANGTKNGIVWALSSKTWDGGDRTAVLYAYDAENVAHQLYNSNQVYERDHASRSLRFAIPTVVNGRVYVGTKREVAVYGLLPAAKK
jgi:hypothetical protein